MELHPALSGPPAERTILPERARVLLHELFRAALNVVGIAALALLLRGVGWLAAGGPTDPRIPAPQDWHWTAYVGSLALGALIAVWRVSARRRSESLMLFGDRVVGAAGDEGDLPVVLQLASIPPDRVGRRTLLDRLWSEARIDTGSGPKIVYRPAYYDPEELKTMLEAIRRAAHEARDAATARADGPQDVSAARA